MAEQFEIQQVELEWAYRFLGFGPVVLVSTTDGMKGDVSTVAWSAPCAKNPPRFVVSIGKEHKTYRNIMQTGYFGINVPTVDSLDLVMYCGTRSGHKVDKVADYPIAVRPGVVLDRLPLVQACAAWLECRLVPGVEAGTQSVIVAEAVAASCRVGVLNADHTWTLEAFPSLHPLGGRKFLAGSEVVLSRSASP